MTAIISAFAPLIVQIGLAVLKGAGVKKDNQRKFIQSVINNSNEKTSIKLRDQYKELLDADAPDGAPDVFEETSDE
jgi:hypothetical protein